MTVSKQLPSISRIVDELDGMVPGFSAYEIIRSLAWSAEPKRTSRSQSLQHLNFVGASEGCTATYHASILLEKAKDTRLLPLPVDSELVLELGPDAAHGPTKTIIRCRKTEAIGSSRVIIAVHHGVDDRHPCYEGVVGGAGAFIHTCMTAAHKSKKCSPQILSGTAHGQIYLARMALYYAIDWRKHVMSALPTKEETSARFAAMVEDALIRNPG